MRQATLPGLGPDEEPPERPPGDVSPPAPAAAPEVAVGETPDLAGKTVWVVDANSLIFQVFHAIPEMTSPRGQPVSAVFGFTRDLFTIVEQHKPDYLFVAFDTPEPTFRHELFPAYKGERAELPVDLAPQFELIDRVVAGMNLARLDCPGYEADDILAMLARATQRQGGECYLVTADKDCRQLISASVRIYNMRKGQAYDAAALAADWGVRPEQVVDFQSLVGDPVDNVPGVPLIGPKIAAELLAKYGTLDELLDRAAELPKGKRKENLLAGREQALASRELVRLNENIPICVDWNAARVRGVDREKLLELFLEFGFKGLAQKVGALPAAEPAPQWQVEYRAVDTPEKLAAFLEWLARQEEFSFDTETTHIWPCWAELVGMSFSARDGEAYYLPVRAPDGEPRLDLQTTLEALRPILENPAVGKIGQNLKYDMIVLRGAGVKLAGARFDTMIASYLLDAGERNHNLDELSARYLRHKTIKIEQLIGSGKSQKSMADVPLAEIVPYAAEDADVAWRLRAPLAARLESEQLTTLFESLEMPLVEVLVELESNGIFVDRARLVELSEKYEILLANLRVDIYDLAGGEFNIDSPKQLQQVLFEQQKLPIIKRTKTGGSTDADVLEELARQHPLPRKILEYRKVAKLKGTYVDALPAMILPRSGRVHSSFNQVVAATGRLSSNDPNLQNIPIRSERGREIRQAFRAGQPGWRLLAADYSQIELRILAHFSRDEALCDAFARDEDIHALVASQVSGVPLENVTSELRRQAKAVNFGVIYGQSPFGLARQLNIEQEEAARFIDAYFDRYQGVERFLQKILEDCARDGYVRTILGRRRAISGIRSAAGRQRNLPERTAINTVIQGSAADLIKLAMVAIHHKLKSASHGARMLLQIHDELVFETPQERIDELARTIGAEMSSVLPLSVPLKVDVSQGENWADMEPWPPTGTP